MDRPVHAVPRPLAEGECKTHCTASGEVGGYPFGDERAPSERAPVQLSTVSCIHEASREKRAQRGQVVDAGISFPERCWDECGHERGCAEDGSVASVDENVYVMGC